MKVIKGDNVVKMPDNVPFKMQNEDKTIDVHELTKQGCLMASNGNEVVWTVPDGYEVEKIISE